MKKYIFLVLFELTALSLTGCYTQLVVEEDDDYYVYHEPVPIIIYYPAPEPILIPIPPHHPPKRPNHPIYKKRKPVPPTVQKRKRDDIRNSGGRNDGENRSRR